MNIALLGGNWTNGSYAGCFALHLNNARSCADIPLRFFPPAFIATEGGYPDYIPKRWIYLSRHARKQRTRKKWKHQIEREIRLHKKRAQKTKGANT